MELPNWIPWMVVGGIVFASLSFVAAKYSGRQQKSTAIAQDFLSGSILIALLGALIPDYFPQFPIQTPDLLASGQIPFSSVIGGNSSDIDLQLGPLGLKR